MTQRQRGWLILPASLLLVCGVFVGRNTSDVLFPFIACIPALVAIPLLKRKGRFIACLSFSFVLGVTSGCSAFHPSLPAEDTYAVRGIVSDEITTGSFGQYRVYLSDITLNDHAFSGGAYWTFYTDEPVSELSAGKSVSFRASLYHPAGAVNPGGYNFREYLLQRGVLIGLYGNDSLIVSEPDFFSPAGWIASLRHRLSSSLVHTLGDETGAYASALLLGMRSMIPLEDRQSFSRLGIAHILSVSGFHVSILIGLLAALFRLLRLRPRLRIILFTLILFLYSALCGMNQPVIRASLLLLMGLSGRVLNRPRSGLHLLCASLFIMTLLSPVQVTSASYQLTFCAVFGLFLFQPLSHKVMSLPVRPLLLRRFLASLVLLFGIQLGLLFPVLFFFQRLPLMVYVIGIPATLVFSALIIVLWLFLLFLPFPGLASLLGAPLRLFTGSLLSVVRTLGSLPGLTVWIRSPGFGTALGILLLFGGFCCYFRMKRSVRISFLLTGTVLVVLSLLPVSHNAAEYIQFSAGNADAALLWDHDRVYVIDTGESDGTLSTFLRSNRLTPDGVILTHLHADHAGGLLSLLDDEIPIRKLYLPYGADTLDIHPDFLDLLHQLRASGTEIFWLSRGDVLPLPSGTMTVLWPESEKVRPGQDANNYSLVLRLNLNGSTFLHTGDITGIYESYCTAPADLLKAAHHGSSASTLSGYLSTVSPQAVILSCRHQSRLDAFRERCGDIPVYGTPETGAVTIRFNEGSFSVTPFLSNNISRR